MPARCAPAGVTDYALARHEFMRLTGARVLFADRVPCTLLGRRAAPTLWCGALALYSAHDAREAGGAAL
jgi:hypothetical protein